MERTLHSTRALRTDQQRVLRELGVFERAVDALDGSDAAISALREFDALFEQELGNLLWKEECVLFPAIKPFVSPGENGVEQMLDQHEQLKSASQRLQRGIYAFLNHPGEREAVTLIQESSAQVAELLKNHFPDEDAELLTVADAYLTQAQDHQVLDLFATVEAHLAWCFAQLDAFHPW